MTTTGSPVGTLSSAGALPSGVTFVDNGNGTATSPAPLRQAPSGTYPLTITAANGWFPTPPRASP